MAALEVKGVSKYFGGLAALDGINLAIGEGEIRGIIGPNGAGKTTLYNIISGVYRPTKGEVVYQGKVISGLRSDLIAGMGIVRTLQGIALFHEYSVLTNVKIARHLHAKIGVFGAVSGRARHIERG